MKLARVSFDDTVLIPLGRDVGGGVARQDLRDSSFDVAEGWDLSLEGNVVRVWREGMPAPAFVTGYGFTFTERVDERKATPSRRHRTQQGEE